MSNNVPDFDDMMKLADKIGDLQRESLILDLQIKEGIAKATHAVMNDSNNWLDGKRPSMELVKSTFHVSGLNGELIPLRIKLAEVDADLERSKLKFQVYRDMVTMYVTDSANKRASVL